jgi:hypothetical protein
MPHGVPVGKAVAVVLYAKGYQLGSLRNGFHARVRQPMSPPTTERMTAVLASSAILDALLTRLFESLIWACTRRQAAPRPG